MNLRHFWALVLLSVIIVSCASGPYLVRSWRDPGYTGPAFKKVVVVGLAKRESSRRIFESIFALKLREKGIEAVVSYEANPSPEKLPREEIERLVKENGIDAIITARIVDRKEDVHVVPPTTTVIAPYPDYYGHYYGYYDHAWAVYHDPGYIYTYETVSIETNVYETSSYGIVWTGISETIDPVDLEKETQVYAEGIIKKLVAGGLLAPGAP